MVKNRRGPEPPRPIQYRVKRNNSRSPCMYPILYIVICQKLVILFVIVESCCNRSISCPCGMLMSVLDNSKEKGPPLKIHPDQYERRNEFSISVAMSGELYITLLRKFNKVFHPKPT